MRNLDTPSPTRCEHQQSIRYVTHVDQLRNLPADELARIAYVSRTYAFRATDYYLGLIDWQDPNDPIRRLIVPRAEELNTTGRLDASNEAANTLARGLQHKYPDTAVLLCSEVCGGFCRYCFRKRLFMDGVRQAGSDMTLALN